MFGVILFVLGGAALAIAMTSNKYCQLCRDHTMCITPDISPACRQGGFASGVDAKQQNAILHTHNVLRNKVAMGMERRGKNGPQPSASDMKVVVWNSELAKIAQRWANQCNFDHDSCRNIDHQYVGQNLYISMSSPCKEVTNSPDWETALTVLYEEVKIFNKDYVPRYVFELATGHYTQVVWANTTSVGCGFSAYKEGDWCKKFYVCNYGPGGNIEGLPMYTIGEPRASCRTSKIHSEYSGLC